MRHCQSLASSALGIQPTDHAVEALSRAVTARDQLAAWHSALDLRLAVLDLQLQFRPPAEIDRARLDLWAQRVLVDAGAADLDATSGDVATLEWVRDRSGQRGGDRDRHAPR